MAQALTNYNQQVFLNNQKLKGVTSVDESFSVNHVPVNVLGQGAVNQVMSDVPQMDFSITREVPFVDIYSVYTGINRSIEGSINYGDTVFGFNEGFLTSYSYSVEYGSVPLSTLGLTVYGDMGTGDANATTYGSLNASGQSKDQVVKIPRPSDITISCFGSSSNRVKSFDFSTSINKNAVYAIGYNQPIQVSTMYPMLIDTSFVLEIDDFESRRVSDYLTKNDFDDFSISVKGIIYDPIDLEASSQQLTLPDGTLLRFLTDDSYSVSQVFSFNSSNTKLVGQEVSSSNNDISSVRLNYQTYLNNKYIPRSLVSRA